MNIVIHDKHKIKVENIKDIYENNSTLKLQVKLGGSGQMNENGGFSRAIQIDVHPTRLLQKIMNGKELYEKFDVGFSLEGNKVLSISLLFPIYSDQSNCVTL